LTAGCAKYRYNKLNLGDIGGIPGVLYCNDSYSLAVIALLALLYLGVKNIHLGPTLPAFLSPNVAEILVEKFYITGITDVENDLCF
jgi:hydroxylamine reductase